MNALAINRDQAWAGSAGAGNALLRRLHGQRCQPASDHREFQSARHATSLVRRKLGRGFGSGRFLRLGWSYASDFEFSEADRLVKAGVDSRVAAQLVANHSAASGSIQGITERHPVHLPASFPDHVFHAPKPMDGEHGSVPGQAGELPLQRGERPDVGGC